LSTEATPQARVLPSRALTSGGSAAAVEAGHPEVEQGRQVIQAFEEFDVHGAPEVRVGGHGGEDDRRDVAEAPKAGGPESAALGASQDAPGRRPRPGALPGKGGVPEVGHDFRDEGSMSSCSRRAAAACKCCQDFRTGQVPGEGGVGVYRAGAPSQGQAVPEGLGRELRARLTVSGTDRPGPGRRRRPRPGGSRSRDDSAPLGARRVGCRRCCRR